jgi:O-antigen/teichoic acid export membrane protein
LNAVKARIARGVVWLVATRIVVSTLGALSTVILARFLLPADFGLVAIATTVLTILQAMTQMSLAAALMQRSSYSDADVDTAWTLGMLRGVLLTLVIAAISPAIASLYSDERLLPVLLVTAVAGGISAVTNPRLTLLTKQLRFEKQFVAQAVQKASVFVATVALAAITRSYWSLVLGNLFAVIASTVFSYMLEPYRPRLRLRGARALLAFTGWTTVSQTMIMLNWRFEQLLMGYFLGKTELGQYVVADTLSSIPTREATQPLAQTLFPGFANLKSEPIRLRNAFLLAQSTLLAVSLPIGVGFACVARPALILAMGPNWTPIIPMVQIFSVMFAFQTLTTGVQGLGLASDRTRSLAGRDTRSFLFRVPLVSIGLFTGGLYGLIWARVLSGAINIYLDMRLAADIIGVSALRQMSSQLRTLVATGVMAAVTTGAMHLTTQFAGAHALISQAGAGVLAGVASYVGTILALWRLAGRPTGPEIEFIRAATTMINRFTPFRARKIG